MQYVNIHRPKQIRSRQTLQRITQASLELIAQRGVERTTINEIVRRANSSVGSFYARFEGKEDLLAYLDERIWENAEKRWIEARDGQWNSQSVYEIVNGLAKLYAELELMHQDARKALAQALRGPGAGPSEPALRFKAKLLEDSRQLLLNRTKTISHPSPEIAIETTCRSLEACAFSLEPTILADLCAALVFNLTGEHHRSESPPKDVEFFDIWG